MIHDTSLDQLVDRVCRHWEARRRAEAARKEQAEHPVHAFTIAVAREAGILGTSVAREVGRRLDWQVYDHELLERIATEMGLRTNLLESVDEKRESWLRESAEAFMDLPSVSENAYVQHLIGTVLALGAHGECVIVGRGAAQVLPPDTTLRVRLVAPLKDRIEALARQRGLSRQQAACDVEHIDRDRVDFVQNHFLKDPADPRNYDLLLNTSRFSIGECAELIIEALHRLQARALHAGRVLSSP